MFGVGTAAAALMGADSAPRITQNANNSDFSLEIGFESAPSADGHRQGVTVEGPGMAPRFIPSRFDPVGGRVSIACELRS